jgi:hypothetical protein
MVSTRQHLQPGAVGQPTRDDSTVAALTAAVTAAVAGPLAMTEWAEDEIDKATHRHPEQADALYHAFSLIRPRHIGPGMTREFVYRSHAGELLERIAAGTDTRAATAAELCLVCAKVSQQAPLHGAAAGLYFRLWQAAFPGHPSTPDQTQVQVHYEKLYSRRMDDLEQELRRRCAVPHRRLTGIDCAAAHHGRRVPCRYATPPAG